MQSVVHVQKCRDRNVRRRNGQTEMAQDPIGRTEKSRTRQNAL